MLIAAPYSKFGPHKLVQDAYTYIKKPPNPIRRTLRFCNTVFIITPVGIVLASSAYGLFFTTGIFFAGCFIVEGTVLLPLAILHDIGVSGYKHINNFIDLFDENTIQTQPLPEIQKTDLIESHAIILNQFKANEVLKIQKFTDYTQTYIRSFEQKTPYSEQIKNLQLTDKELLRFQEYLDPITLKIIDIPVQLNDHVYDLSTLCLCYKTKRQDPLNNISFKLSHVSPDRDINGKIQALIKQIQQEKMVAENEREFEITVEDSAKLQM